MMNGLKVVTNNNSQIKLHKLKSRNKINQLTLKIRVHKIKKATKNNKFILKKKKHRKDQKRTLAKKKVENILLINNYCRAIKQIRFKKRKE